MVRHPVRALEGQQFCLVENFRLSQTLLPSPLFRTIKSLSTVYSQGPYPSSISLRAWPGPLTVPASQRSDLLVWSQQVPSRLSGSLLSELFFLFSLTAAQTRGNMFRNSLKTGKKKKTTVVETPPAGAPLRIHLLLEPGLRFLAPREGLPPFLPHLPNPLSPSCLPISGNRSGSPRPRSS